MSSHFGGGGGDDHDDEILGVLDAKLCPFTILLILIFL